MKVVCRVVEDLVCHEFPIGFYQLRGTSAEELFAVVNDVLKRLQIDINNCRGKMMLTLQSYLKRD